MASDEFQGDSRPTVPGRGMPLRDDSQRLERSCYTDGMEPIPDIYIDALVEGSRWEPGREICIICGIDFPKGNEKQYFCSNLCKQQFRGKKRDYPKELPVKKQRKIGDRYLDPQGYVVIVTDSGSVKEHRLIMETMIGRKLKRGESVHHRDGTRHNNTEENLELWIGGIRYGQRASELTCPHCGEPYLVT